MARATLAATAGASWGVYGPAFELCASEPREPGSEEYAHSEKYEVRAWDVDDPLSLRPWLTRLNEIRARNPALHDDRNLRLVDVDNEKLLAYVKASGEPANALLVVINLDPHHVHSGWVDVPLAELGLEEGRSYQMHDLLSDARYLWYGRRNFVKVDPLVAPAHVFRLRHRIRTERDFDYYM
jgi:starch synthase (maltosyl-transferring)